MKHQLSTKFDPIRVILSLMALTALLAFVGCDLLATPEPPAPTPTFTSTPLPSPTIDWFPATPTPTQAALPSSTPLPTQEGGLAGITTLLVSDDFTDESLWQASQGTLGNVAFGTQNLSLALARPDATLTSLSQHSLPPNFYLEITIQTSLCEPLDQFGLLFWQESNQDYYRLLLNCAGQHRLELIQGGQNFVVRDWETASQMALAAPATNRLALWVRDGQVQLYINDIFQFSEGIAQERSGVLGVFARTVSSGAMTVRFSNLEIFRVEPE